MESYGKNHNKASSSNVKCRRASDSDDDSARQDTGSDMLRIEGTSSLHRNGRANNKTNGRREGMSKDREYFWGLILTIIGGASLCDYITYNHGSFMISVTVFSIGLGMILWSYTK